MIEMIRSVIKEYGAGWAFNRFLYSLKLNILRLMPIAEKLFEKKTAYPDKLDLFQIDTDKLQAFLQNLDPEDKQQLTEEADKIWKVNKVAHILDLRYCHVCTLCAMECPTDCIKIIRDGPKD